MRGARNRDGEKKLVGSQMKHSKRQDVSLVAAARGGGPCWSFPDKLRSHEEQKIFFDIISKRAVSVRPYYDKWMSLISNGSSHLSYYILMYV